MVAVNGDFELGRLLAGMEAAKRIPEHFASDEERVQALFCRWFDDTGWIRITDFTSRDVDVLAARTDESGQAEWLLVECKGNKGNWTGTAVDVAYGQLLQRMDFMAGYPVDASGAIPGDPETFRYALVVPAALECVRAACRVPRRVRELLRITVYAVDDEGTVYTTQERRFTAPNWADKANTRVLVDLNPA